MRVGDLVIIMQNPHDTRVVNVVGKIQSIRSKAGTGGGDLIDVEFGDPQTGGQHVLPFSAPCLTPATRQHVQALADQLEARAAVLRSCLPALRQ